MTAPTPAALDALAALRRTLPGITTPFMGGDNLSIFLASFIESAIDGVEMDDSGTWKQGALDVTDEILDAIHAHYAAQVETLTAERHAWKAQAESDQAELVAAAQRNLGLIIAREASDTARASAETALAEAREALRLFQIYGCPVCNGDCASANPPVPACPMQAARAALQQKSPPAIAEAECTDCGGTGITFQTERRCACQGPQKDQP